MPRRRAFDVALETQPFRSPPPNSSLPTAFTAHIGSSNQFVIGTSVLPIVGYQFSLNAPLSAGAKINFVALQSGIG